MPKVKYYAAENTALGTHSFYAVAVPNGTMTFDEVCEQACRNTTIEVSILKAAVTEYMKAVQHFAQLGFRVPVGEKFLTVYPTINLSVKDEFDKDGKLVKSATAKMVNAGNAKSRLGCSVAAAFSNEFEQNISWQKVDRVTGAAVEEEEDITQNPTDTPPTGGGERV